jgi:hypothetical protein
MTTAEITGDAVSRNGCRDPRLGAAIADHFAGRGTPAAEAALRAHLLECAACDARYRRHLLLARLDPRALPAAERLGRGLGFSGRRPAARPGWWALRLCVPAAAILLFVLIPHRRGAPGGAGPAAPGEELAARGRAPGAPSFWTYRLGGDGVPRLADRTIGRADEVAFAYSNAAGKPFLMIFGVDEHRHVYWFHPDWRPGTPAPGALEAHAGPGPYELPEAIRQPFDGARLRLFAAFGERRFDAAMVQAAVRGAPDGDPTRALEAGGVAVLERTIEVKP